MEDNKPEEQPSESSTESQESVPESNTTTENNNDNTGSEQINEEPIKKKWTLPSFRPDLSGIKNIYETQYKKLLIIPITLLVIAIFLIGFKLALTGEFIDRDVSLKGGITITISSSQQIDISQLKTTLSQKFPQNDLLTKSLTKFGSQVGVIIEIDLTEADVNDLLDEIGKALNIKLTPNDYSIEIVGSSLGASFFKEIIIALLIAFVLMALVVFIYFRTIIPSAAVILAVFSDILITVAIVNLLGLRISTAGIAAFLMLIGYSVDTNILLSTRVLKRKEGTESERFYGALKTGIMMSSTTLTAIITALIFTQSEVITQIMTILLIGLLVDLINTWIQNVAILRMYLKKKQAKYNEL